MSASRGPVFTTALLDDLAVIYAVAGVAEVPFDLAPYGYSRADVEAHLKQHGLRLAGQIAAGRQDKAAELPGGAA